MACTDVVLNLTLRCPLRCAHCCYRSSPHLTGAMPGPLVARAIRDAAALGTVRTVHFSGGDPFLEPGLMIGGIALATSLGLRTAAVTSAYFARTPLRARRMLGPMAAEGLSEVSVSYDDMHAAFLPPGHLVNAVGCASELGLAVFVSVTVGPGSRIDRAHVLRLLGLCGDEPGVRVMEVGVNGTGRAADTPDRVPGEGGDGNALAYRGPCAMVLRTVQVTADGRVFPCCGVLPHGEPMAIGDAREPGGLVEAVRAAQQEPLWHEIASRGPVELLAETAADAGDAAAAGWQDGNCAACERLFSQPEMLQRARRRAAA